MATSYDQFLLLQMQKMGAVAPGTAAPAPPPPPPELALAPASAPAAPAPAAEPVVTQGTMTPSYGGPAPPKAVYAEPSPDPVLSPSAKPVSEAPAPPPIEEQYAAQQAPAVATQLRRADQVAGQGIFAGGGFEGGVRQSRPNVGILANAAYEADLQRRAQEQVRDPEGWGDALADATAPLAAPKEAIGALLPDQLDAAASAVGAAKDAVVGRVGVSEEATQEIAAPEERPAAPEGSGMPSLLDMAGATAKGAWEGLTAEEDVLRKPAAAALGAVVGAGEPQAQVVEVIGTRAYDRAVHGDENRTYDDSLLTGFYEDVVGSGFSPVAFGRWQDDPANKDTIDRLYNEGYQGYTKGTAVYQFYRDQQGLGGVATDIAYDPLATLEVGAAVATGGLAGAATGVGRVVGREAAGMAAGNIIRGAGRVATAVAVDPFDAPGVVRDAARIVAPDLTGAAGRRATDFYTDVILTERGRREVAMRNAEQVGQRAARGIADQPAPEPWLFERDASGAVVVDPATQRPIVRDLGTGQLRPMEQADFPRAMQIMGTIPHARSATRVPGQPTPLELMERDWFDLAMDPARMRAARLGRAVEHLYPRHGPQYEATVGMYAARMRRYGQEVIDGLYEAANAAFKRDLADLNRAKRSAPSRAADPVAYAQWEKDVLKPAQTRVTQAAYRTHQIEAAQAIAGIPDAKAATHRKWAKQMRRAAEALPGYGPSVGPTAMHVSGAVDAAGAPGRRLAWDEGLSLPDEDRALLGETLPRSGVAAGQELSGIVADLRRLKDLADDAASRAAAGAALSKWDQRELGELLKRYRYLFPDFDPKDAAAAQRVLDTARTWSDDQLAELVGLEFRQRYAQEQGWLDSARRPTETGTDWADKTGPLGARLSGVVRGLDAIARGTSKWTLHNPARAPGFAALQLVGNAATQGVAKPGALTQYLRPAQWAKGFRQLQGDTTVLTNYDRYVRAKGMGANARVRSTLDPQRYGSVEGVAQGYFQAAKHAAAAFDLANAQSTFMATVLGQEKKLQRWMRLPSGNRLDGFSTRTVRTPTETARAMGVPASRVPDAAIAQALDAARRGKPYGALSAQEVKNALHTAANVPPGADATVDAWVDRVGRDYVNLSKRIEDAGLAEKDRVAFSWNETKADAVLSRLFLFHYWNTRASYLYARNLLGSPAMLNAYVSLFRTLEQESERGGYPGWLTGFARFMLTPAGVGVFMNPTATFNTMTSFASEAMKPDEGFHQRLTPLGEKEANAPLMVHPVWDNLLTISGALGADARPSQILPTAALNRELYDLANLVGVNTGALDQPIDARWRNAFGGENSRAVAEFVQDRLFGLDEPMRARDANATADQGIYYLMLQNAMNEGLTQEEAVQRVYEEGGQFNPDSPLYQQALDQWVDLPFLGAQLGLDPDSVPAHVVGALTSYLGPFPAQTDVTLKTQTGNRIGRYLDMQDAGSTWQQIAGVDGLNVAEPVRIGGYRLQIPGTFTAIDAGGTVYTPDDLAAMTPEQRKALADQYLDARFPLPPGQQADTEFPEDAMAAVEDARATSPEMQALRHAERAYWTPGDPETALAHEVYQAIARAELEGTVTLDFGEGVAPETYDNERLKLLTEGERYDLADAWAALTGQAPLLDAFKAQQLQAAIDFPQLGAEMELSRMAGEYAAGPVRFVEDLMAANPSYAEYATTLDPERYPPGSAEWARKMTDLDASLVLSGERHRANAPLSYDDPGAGILPAGGTTAALAGAWQERQAEFAAGSEYEQNVRADVERIGQVLAAADAYDAETGYEPGTSRAIIMQQIVTGDTKTYRVDKTLYDALADEFGGVTEDGQQYGPVPTGESAAREYVLWALRQPEDARAIDTYFALSSLEYAAEKRAAGQVVTDPLTGEVTVIDPEDVPPVPGEESAFLSGISLQRSADGSGEFLAAGSPASRPNQTTYTPAEEAAPVAPANVRQVGQLGGTLYAAPDGASQAITNILPGTTVEVLADKGRYYEVSLGQYVDGQPVTGYVAKAMVTGTNGQPIAPAAPTAPVAPAQPPPNANGGFLGAVGSGIASIFGHGPAAATTPPTKPAQTSAAAPAPAAAPASEGTTPPGKLDALAAGVTPAYVEVEAAPDGMGVRSTLASDRMWMERMVGDGHAIVTTDYKGAPPPGVWYGYQNGHGADGSTHAAYDISCDTGYRADGTSTCPGTPITAPIAGKVVCAGYGQGTGEAMGSPNCTYSQGTTHDTNERGEPSAHTVVIDVGTDAAGNPIQLSLNHMGSSVLTPGQVVNPGDLVGTMGDTDGGPHVHVEAWAWCPSANTYVIVDPTLVVNRYFKGNAVC